MNVNGELLKQAFGLAIEGELAATPAEKELSYTFSEAFKIRNTHIINYGALARPIGVNTKKVLVRILVAAILVALLAGTAIAAPLVIKKLKAYEIHKDDHGMNVIEVAPTVELEDEEVAIKPEIAPFEPMLPTYIPDNFEVEKQRVGNYLSYMDLTSKSPSVTIKYAQQSLLCEGTPISITEDAVHSQININGIEIDLFQFNCTYNLFWADSHSLYDVYIKGDLPFDEIEKFIAGIAKVEQENPQESATP